MKTLICVSIISNTLIPIFANACFGSLLHIFPTRRIKSEDYEVVSSLKLMRTYYNESVRTITISSSCHEERTSVVPLSVVNKKQR